MKYIYGLGKSGKSIINYLDKINEDYCCWDDNDNIKNNLYLRNKKIKLIQPNNLNFDLIKESYISPGISFDNKNILALRLKKIKLYRDLELYSQITKDKQIIAITGTNGKSTTTKLISDILKYAEIDIFSGGNIGEPLLNFTNQNTKTKYHVIELSSFQLESNDSFNPFISILLNISEDHLDRYNNFNEYILQKEKIITSNKFGYNIVCVDDKNTKNIFHRHKKKIIPISSNYIEKGIYFENNKIIDNYFNEKKDLEINEISSSLFGSFNIENILASYVVCRILNINFKNFVHIIKNFKGLPHRLEKIYENNKLQIINNSKATNVASSLKSVISYNNINLILGGRAKEKNFKSFIHYKSNINKIYLIGEASDTIFKQISQNIECELCTTLESAIKQIFLDLKNKRKFQTILFSPACSSFDQFINFEQRGDLFKKIINKVLDV